MAKSTKNQKAGNSESMIRKRMLEVLGAYFDENGGSPQNLPKDIANEILHITKLTGKEQKSALRQFENKYMSKQVESDRWAEKINKDFKKNLNSGKDNISNNELGKSFEKLKTKFFYGMVKEKSTKEEFNEAAQLIQEVQTSLNSFINNAITEYKKQYPNMDEDIAIKDYQQRFADKINKITNEASSVKDLKQKLAAYLETIKQVTSQLKTNTPKEDKTMTDTTTHTTASDEDDFNYYLTIFTEAYNLNKKDLTEFQLNAAREYFNGNGSLGNFVLPEKEAPSNNQPKKENTQQKSIPQKEIINIDEDDFNHYLNIFTESHNLNKKDLTEDQIYAARVYFSGHGSLGNFILPEKEGEKSNSATKELKLGEPEKAEDPTPQQKEEKETVPYDEQLQSIKEHWEKWCAETKDEKEQPLRNFKEIPNEDGFLKFEIKPTEALKAKDSNAKGAEVTYYSETEATMPMTDYDYFHQMAKAAKEVSHAEVIECGNIKTPGYATRLIAAAYANGLDVEKAPNKLDLSNETLKGIKNKDILTVLNKQIFNRSSDTAEKIDYDSIKDALRVYKDIQEHSSASEKEEDKIPEDQKQKLTNGKLTSLDISKMQFSDEAAKNKTIAAALEMGINIEGVDKLNLTQEGKEGLPEEAGRLLGKMQVGLLRAKAQKLHDPNTSQEEREALKTEKMKQFDAKDKTRLVQEQKAKLSSKEATKEEKNIAATRLDTLQGKRWELGYRNNRGGHE